MATRATYDIEQTVFYIHWDGYPTGAAVYFWYMHKARKQGKGGAAESFLRGNSDAEITRSHETHGDTEYRYTLRGNLLTVEKRYGESFSEIFSGNWWEFVNANSEQIPEFEPLSRVLGVATGSELAESVAAASLKLAQYVRSFPTHSGNMASLRDDLNRKIDALITHEQSVQTAAKKVAAA